MSVITRPRGVSAPIGIEERRGTVYPTQTSYEDDDNDVGEVRQNPPPLPRAPPPSNIPPSLIKRGPGKEPLSKTVRSQSSNSVRAVSPPRLTTQKTHSAPGSPSDIYTTRPAFPKSSSRPAIPVPNRPPPAPPSATRNERVHSSSAAPTIRPAKKPLNVQQQQPTNNKDGSSYEEKRAFIQRSISQGPGGELQKKGIILKPGVDPDYRESLPKPLNSSVDIHGQIHRVHVLIPGLDIQKMISFDRGIIVKEAIFSIIEKAKIPNGQLHNYILEVADYSGSPTRETIQLDPSRPLESYRLRLEDIILFKVMPHPLAARFSEIVITNLDGKIETMQVDYSEPVTQLISTICLKYNYNSEEVYLQFDGVEFKKKLVPLQSLKEQGITSKVTLRVKKRKKRELQRQRYSVATIKKRIGENAPMAGITLVATSDYVPVNSSQIGFKKGDKITVIAEDSSVWWKGRVGDKVGLFPVSETKYFVDEFKADDQKVRDELEKGMRKFGTKLQQKTLRSIGMFPWRKKESKLTKSFERHSDAMPKMVEDVFNFLEKSKAYTEEGIFRISGNLKALFQLKKQYEKGKSVDFFKLQDVHTTAGLLKLFFRELENPLFTFELYDVFVTAVKMENEDVGLQCIKEGLQVLPPANKMIAARLFAFLHQIVLHKEQTKMTAANLAIVFAPSLFRPKVETVEAMMSGNGQKLIETIITHYLFIFQTPSREMPSTPEFKAVLRRSSLLLDENLQAEKAQAAKQKNQPQQTDDDDNIEEEISIADLVDCMLEGNESGVQQYLDTLSPEQRDRIEEQLKQEISQIMSSKGIRSDKSGNVE